MTPERVGRALRSGVLVSDHAFDVHLAPPFQRIAGLYWTPVEVAAKAAWWLAELGAHTVLDAGAGAGKFCVIAALARELEVTGVEHRAELAAHARALATRFGVAERVRIVDGRLETIDLRAFDALYAFNPFGENLFSPATRIDSTVPLSAERHRLDVTFLERALVALPDGRLLATYHGFGGRVPGSFECVRQAALGTDVLRVWRKTRDAPGAWWTEVGDEMVLVPGPSADAR